MKLPDPQSFIPPRTQAPCCYTSAIEDDATYCGECGKPLVRCMAIEECGGLLDDNGLCTVCVSPHIQVDAGAVIAAQVGSAVSLPLSIANLSVVGRPIFVTHLWTREAGGAWQEQSLGWERLAAGEARPVSVTAEKIDRAGAHSLEILIAVSSRWRWRQECFAFATSLRLNIEGDKSDNGPVVNIGGETAGHGNVVYISGQDSQSDERQTAEEAFSLAMVRVEKEERILGLRGINEQLWVPRSARFEWRGFEKHGAPSDGLLLHPDGLLVFGRSKARNQNGPNDAQLLILTEQNEVDPDRSRLFSRRHFELYLECDRLMLRVESEVGLRVNGDAYGRGKTVQLNHGDIISPAVKKPDLLRIAVKFHIEHGAVSTITLTRSSEHAKGS